MTLLELVIAMAIMTVIVGTLAGLSHGVQQSYEYGEAYGTITQHARVVLERISRTVNEASASVSFPGFLVLCSTDGGVSFPDTLVVWHPTGTAANPSGLPLYRELVVYCFDPATPKQLLEISTPNDSRTVPAVTDLSTWATEINALKTSSTSQKVKLTNLLRTASVSSTVRGVVRFASRLTPSDTEWAALVAGTKLWKELSWPQGTYGSKTGLRQAWVRIEVQLVPTSSAAVSNAAALEAIPFFASGTVYYPVPKPN